MIDITRIIGQAESQSLEYKAVLPPSKNIAQLICAFANADGGVHGHQPLDHRPAHSAIGECLPHITDRSLTLPSVIDHRQDSAWHCHTMKQ